MTFLADLHIHSRFSRATSKDLSPRQLETWARIKGIDVLGTGDFTHPGWREELKEQLELDENTGLYKLRSPQSSCAFLPQDARCLAQKEVRFLLQTEVSSIYKKNGRVRKIHNLLYVPTIEDAERFSTRLGKIANLSSDGRPILGLDSRDLLELFLETVPEGVLIPAHIWTPWFSLFGSKSGFDSIEECFEDLTPMIFALETGLSSDPAMNRYISALDSYCLVSNSDAHSANKLAREANVFEGTPSYGGIFQAIRASAHKEAISEHSCRFLGTVEFFPEEGKYHLDGHRTCQVSMTPLEAQQCQNICPVCGKPLTIGVLHRVMELADRKTCPSPLEPPFSSLIPLPEITAEILGYGVASAKVTQQYNAVLTHLGSEMEVLMNLPLQEISLFWEELGEAIKRLRQGEVERIGGYDGAFGQIRLFKPGELGCTHTRSSKASAKTLKKVHDLPLDQSLSLFQEQLQPAAPQAQEAAPISYSKEQLTALTAKSPALVLAGPGAGKTHLLLGRIHHLLENGVDPCRILAVTFTRRAAKEMEERLAQSLRGRQQILCTTLHAFCLKLLKNKYPEARLLNETEAKEIFFSLAQDLSPTQRKHAWLMLTRAREQRLQLSEMPSELATLFCAYEKQLQNTLPKTVDFISLLEEVLKLQAETPCTVDALLVDEIQDCSRLNLAVLASFVSAEGQGFFGIGDPDQSIYGFRGAVKDIRAELASFWPALSIEHLGTSYRSSAKILQAAQLLVPRSQYGTLSSALKLPAQLRFCQAPNAQSEAEWIAKQAALLIGSSSHTLSEHNKNTAFLTNITPNDIGILVRFRHMIPPIATALSKQGLPFAAETAQPFWEDETLSRLLSMIKNPKTFDNFPFTQQTLPAPIELLPWLEAQSWWPKGMGKKHAFQELCALYQQEGSWDGFFEQLLWRTREETLLEKTEGIKLLTVHGSKGLEFRVVFIPALEDGLFPSREELISPRHDQRSLWTIPPNDDEELRLFYVGLTRASEMVHLSCAASRMIYGKNVSLPISPFYTRIAQLFQKSKILRRDVVALKEGSLL